QIAYSHAQLRPGWRGDHRARTLGGRGQTILRAMRCDDKLTRLTAPTSGKREGQISSDPKYALWRRVAVCDSSTYHHRSVRETSHLQAKHCQMESIAVNGQLRQNDFAELRNGEHIAFNLHIPLALRICERNVVRQSAGCVRIGLRGVRLCLARFQAALPLGH